MSPLLPLALAWAVGMGLGLFYFGGLWLTVRRLPLTRRPVLLFVGSFIGRTVLTLLGFYGAMGGRWERMLACLAGFLIARLLTVSWLSVERSPELLRGKENAS